MRRLLLIATLLVFGGLVLRGDASPRGAAAAFDVVVNDDGLDCLNPPQTASWLSIHEAADNALPGQTIFVCAGDYVEPQINMDVANVTLTGPGATPASDGIAKITLQALTIRGFNVSAPGVTIEGFEIDATSPSNSAVGIEVVADDVSIKDNAVANAPADGIRVGVGNPLPDNAHIVRNQISHSGSVELRCTCTNALVDHNAFVSNGAGQVVVEGDGARFTNNNSTKVAVTVHSNGGLVDGNSLHLTDVGYGSRYGGNPITISNNDYVEADPQWMTMLIEIYGQQTVTHAVIIRNTFGVVGSAIRIGYYGPGTSVTALIGGSPADANTFHGDPNNGFDLIQSWTPENIPAEYNNWGLCTEGEIEQDISHQPDDPSYGVFDFVPFIQPAGCGATETPTGSPGPTPSATPQGNGLTQGNVDCDEKTGELDAFAIFAHSAGVTTDQTERCPDIGGDVNDLALDDHPWGDLNCDDVVNTVDGIALLRHLAGVDYAQTEPCTDIGLAAAANRPVGN